MSHYDVIIVGGGPVGMGLAIDLGQRGLHVAVLEKYAQPQPVPKGQNLTGRTMEIAVSWGVDKRLRALRTTDRAKNTGGLVSWGTLLSGCNYEWLNRGLVSRYYDEPNERLPQYKTEEALRARAAELGTVIVEYGVEFTNVTQDESGCRVSASRKEVETELQLTASYVVGCDGSRSRLRGQAGLVQTVDDHDKRMLLAVFRSTQLDEVLGEHRHYSIFNNLSPELKGYWQFLGRVDDQREWFFHAPVGLEQEFSAGDLAKLLATVVGKPFDVELVYLGFWDLRFALADCYRNKRLLIAGDAAHSHPPYGGYGINSGFEDARNLGWKLEAIVKGWASDGLLDTYDFERRHVFDSTIRDFIRRSIESDADFLNNFHPDRNAEAFAAELARRREFSVREVEQFAPHYTGSPLSYGTQGLPSALGSHQFSALPGFKLSRHADCVDPGPIRPAEDFVLVTGSSTFEPPAGLAAPLRIVVSETAETADRAILLRPDGYVALNEPIANADQSLETYFRTNGYRL
ncbi:monooxygenase (plasmid) [Neorhizobium sp. SOG26]|uniref:FAD-dependent monooxygenase n=1 Tax=Neorhizobium sp. SOG26 TaxID=2060726 RepID=UPI000E579B6B|nr:FAD-dependent monooxygenase [Neorhizobium sp. SOG26]AXV18082.1 monooxygenase [Neorhizobium sp. SOG26]